MTGRNPLWRLGTCIVLGALLSLLFGPVLVVAIDALGQAGGGL